MIPLTLVVVLLFVLATLVCWRMGLFCDSPVREVAFILVLCVYAVIFLTPSLFLSFIYIYLYT